MKKVLIAYFSLTGETYVDGKIEHRSIGNTEVIARKLQVQTDGDMFHIETMVPYPHDHHEIIELARQELHDGARPDIKNRVADMEQYDCIILGYPNWWGTMPMAVFKFLESYDFSGKTIIPFCTHEGSGLGHSVSDVNRLCPRSHILSGTAIRGGGVAFADKYVERIVKMIK